MNCYITDLFASKFNYDNNYKGIDHRLRNRTTVVKNSYYDLKVYNKHIESGCRVWPMTRCEFRYKSLAKLKAMSLVEVINSRTAKSISFLEAAPDFISIIDDRMSKHLTQKYRNLSVNSGSNGVKQFNYFVAQNIDFIYNRNILKSLYSKICSGSFKDWLYRFNNHGVSLDLVRVDDMKEYCICISQAIKEYMQSPFPR